jgi:hypothetical protein
MSPKNYQLVGTTVLIIAGIVAIWARSVALALVIIGVGFIAWPLYLDTRYGEERPTKKEIGAMPPEEYRRKIKNPKFRKWVDDLKIKIGT